MALAGPAEPTGSQTWNWTATGSAHRLTRTGSPPSARSARLPHRQLKWQRHLTTGLRLVPDRLAERLESLSNGQPGEALQAAETLLAEIVTLAETHCDADIAAFREALSGRRQVIGPPQPGT